MVSGVEVRTSCELAERFLGVVAMRPIVYDAG
jgi:hypothetical protein